MLRIGRIGGLPVELLLLVLGAAVVAAADEPVLRMRLGDDPRWAARGWDDADWQRVSMRDIPLRAGPLWLRWRVAVVKSTTSVRAASPARLPVWRRVGPETDGDSLAFSCVFPYEVYWDGRLLQQSGVVGADRPHEELGPIDHLIRIPDELRTAGPHVVAMRLSTHHFAARPPRTELPLALQNYSRRLVDDTWRPVLPLVGMGCALFLLSLCAVMLEFAERRRPLCLSIALCGALALYCALVAMRYAFDLPYGPYVLVTSGSTLVIAAISILVPWLLAEQFSIPRRRAWLVLILAVLVAEGAFVPLAARELWLSRTMLLGSLAIAAWAAWRRRPYAWAVALAAFLRLVVVTPRESVFAEPAAFVIVGALVLFVCRLLAIQGRVNREKVRTARLTSARLELELLKKNIQPHFLVNTLASIVEVVEREPQTAVRLIEALTNEFRILAQVSGESVIPLGQEIELCRSHLRVMSIRRQTQYALHVQGLDDAALIPPGIFHTLIEGGLTHQPACNREVRFVFNAKYSSDSVRYTLVAEGEAPRTVEPPAEGTGLRYVKARLEESYAGRWSLAAGPVPEGWRTIIDIAPPRGEAAHETVDRGGRAFARATIGTFLPQDSRRTARVGARRDAILGGECAHR